MKFSYLTSDLSAKVSTCTVIDIPVMFVAKLCQFNDNCVNKAYQLGYS